MRIRMPKAGRIWRMVSILTLKAIKIEELMLRMLKEKETMQMANIRTLKAGITEQPIIVRTQKEMRQAQ